ncbi:TPA: DUF2975 domain-containing protein [Serratia marcescens]|jgi:hypothetical protein|uniref:DUF2975 domain-containing protein n=1 Tax=Serratia TaxID=613 RepID=UPI0018D8290C|nr:DUF2975 domain-containing protein [Serratia marcescens]MBH3056322.1 DUF2975 domain-containing protein [Serratia marcescens]MDP8797296.1 DUF2975 domain-containing protein [Serratia marcescens]HEJ0404581.1 DUF2975 domain-containing protein [Serratia marcescens]HEJ7138535.1 DUF2975 domain-containing protein [Serratia marcescens]HEJ7182389.1 DUF2975 domain-containing protein [Serratia marcescens]
MKSISHKVQVRLCWAMEAILIFLMLTLPLVCAWFWLGSYEQYLPLGAEIIGSTSGDNLHYLIDNLVTFFVLCQMFIFSRGVRKGKLFTKKRIRNVRNIGLILVVGYCFNLFIRAFFDSSTDQWNADNMSIISTELYHLQQLLLGGGLFSLSYIFEKGKELEDERKLVV